MTAHPFKGHSFVDPISNASFLSSVDLDKHLQGLMNGTGDPDILSEYLHELAHHVCMRSAVGRSLQLLWLRSTMTAEGRADERVADAAKVYAFEILMQPWLEGIATFVQYDLVPGIAGTSGMRSSVTLGIWNHFFRGRTNSVEGAPISPMWAGMMHRFLAEHRLSATVVSDKADLLVSPLYVNIDKGGYLAGYLCVKAFRELAGARSALGDDPEFVYMYLVNLLFNDLGLVDVLLAKDSDSKAAVNRIAEHIRARIESIIRAGYDGGLATDMARFKDYASRPDQKAAPGDYRFYESGIFTDASVRAGKEKLAASMKKISADAASERLMAMSMFFVLGSQRVRVRVPRNGLYFQMELGEAPMNELLAFRLLQAGEYDSEIVFSTIPEINAFAVSVYIDGRIAHIGLPDSWRGTAVEDVLRAQDFRRGPLTKAIDSRLVTLAGLLRANGDLDGITKDIATTQLELEQAYHGFGLGFYLAGPAGGAEQDVAVEAMARTGMWKVLGRRRELVLAESILSIAMSNSTGRRMALSASHNFDPLERLSSEMSINLEAAADDLCDISAESGLGFYYRNGDVEGARW